MIFPTASAFDLLQFCLFLDEERMNDASGRITTALVPQGLVSHIKAPMPSVLEIMDSIQLATGKGFAIINLANVFCSVPVCQQRLSYSVPSLLIGHNTHLPGYTRGTSRALPSYTIFAGKVVTASTFV